MLPLSPRAVLVTPFLITAILLTPALAEEAAPDNSPVDQALRAEALGENELRNKLLEQAIAQDGDDQLARWYAGQVKLEDKWVSVDQAVEAASASKAYKQYVSRRTKIGLSFTDQAGLARWCERNGLQGPAMAHWTIALRINPKSRSAQEALGVQRIGGEWVTDDKAAAAAEQEDLAMRHKAFVTDSENLVKKLQSDNPERVDEGLDEVASYTNSHELQMLIETLTKTELTDEVGARAAKRVLDSATQVDEPWAIDYAINLALTSPNESVREHAVGTLGYRSENEYVPLLLARLRMPKELSVQVAKDGFGNVVSYYDEFQEGPAYDYKQSYRNTRSTHQRFLSAPVYERRLVREAYTIPPRVVRGCGRPRVIPAIEVPDQYEDFYVRTAYGGPTADSYYREAAATNMAYSNAARKQYEAARSNAYHDEFNGKVAALLLDLTGEDLPPHPRALWDWWQAQWDSNPELRGQDRLSKRLRLVYNLPSGFASGSVVHTRTGPRPIGELQIGDEVLAASPATGELAFKPILSKQVSDGYTIPEIRLAEGGVLGVASGQFVWSTGEGWRLPQDLGDASRLHGLAGSAAVESQTTAKAERVFGLVVADFHTLFVGANKTLVHDTTEPRPTAAALPGWTPSRPLELAVAATNAE